MAAAGGPYHSRFQVLTDGEPAWTEDEKGTLYRFDGFYFTRRRRHHGPFSVVPSWQTPSYGWLPDPGYPPDVLLSMAATTEPSPSKPSPDLAA